MHKFQEKKKGETRTSHIRQNKQQRLYHASCRSELKNRKKLSDKGMGFNGKTMLKIYTKQPTDFASCSNMLELFYFLDDYLGEILFSNSNMNNFVYTYEQIFFVISAKNIITIHTCTYFKGPKLNCENVRLIGPFYI